MRRTIAFLRFDEAATLDWTALGRNAQREGNNLTLLRVVRPPADLPFQPPNSPPPDEVWRDYHAVVLIDGHHPMLDWPRLGRAPALVHAYAVEARTIFERGVPASEPNAVTLLGRLMFHADLPDSAARRSWSLHARLARQVHVGATGYVQNWVVAALSPSCPPARGLPQMRWPDEAALVSGFFDSDRGRDEILHDTAHFVAGGPRFYLRSA